MFSSARDGCGRIVELLRLRCFEDCSPASDFKEIFLLFPGFSVSTVDCFRETAEI
jgi:hypothetical protein